MSRQNYRALSNFRNKYDGGRKLCLNCENPILDKKRRRYCSDKCVNGFFDKNYWVRLREKVMKRDNYKCRDCEIGRSELDEVLEVHHIRAIHDGGEEFNPDNCITLCHSCHGKKHSKIGKIISQHKTLEQYEEE